MAELIEVSFGGLTVVSLRNHVLDGSRDPPWEAAILGLPAPSPPLLMGVFHVTRVSRFRDGFVPPLVLEETCGNESVNQQCVRAPKKTQSTDQPVKVTR